ncbi:MAG: hypothetical protein K6F99_02740 [Lachnospiraceae bacterium]|nr:hypothetical protein [Lachnospiraceae bacterium]
MDNNDVVLYRTVNLQEKELLQRMLVKARCSYLEKWQKVPLFKRREFGGAKEICVIYVNDNQSEQARNVLDDFLAIKASHRKRGGKKRQRKKTAEQLIEERQLAERTPVETRVNEAYYYEQQEEAKRQAQRQADEEEYRRQTEYENLHYGQDGEVGTYSETGRYDQYQNGGGYGSYRDVPQENYSDYRTGADPVSEAYPETGYDYNNENAAYRNDAPPVREFTTPGYEEEQESLYGEQQSYDETLPYDEAYPNPDYVDEGYYDEEEGYDEDYDEGYDEDYEEEYPQERKPRVKFINDEGNSSLFIKDKNPISKKEKGKPNNDDFIDDFIID